MMVDYAARSVFATVMLCLASSVRAANGIDLHIEHDGHDPHAPNTVLMTLSNESDHDVFLYDYNSAFAKPDGRTTSHWFTINDEFGHDVTYKGRYVVSGAPSPSQFTRIAIGSAIQANVNLSTEYHLPTAGSITVSTRVALYRRIPAIRSTGELESTPFETIQSNGVTFGVVNVPERSRDVSAVTKCTPLQEEQTKQAVAAAGPMTEEAVNFLGGLYYIDPIDPENPTPPRIHMKPHARYRNWFGVWDDDAPQPPDPAASETANTRVDQTVIATYVRLQSGATTVCDACVGYHPSARAWAEGTLIHLCPVNFGDPITGGITSQAGTIAHEVSHQTDELAGGTVDVPEVTSRAAAHALPRQRAVTSGANYEYFITDTPLGRASAAAEQLPVAAGAPQSRDQFDE